MLRHTHKKLTLFFHNNKKPDAETLPCEMGKREIYKPMRSQHNLTKFSLVCCDGLLFLISQSLGKILSGYSKKLKFLRSKLQFLCLSVEGRDGDLETLIVLQQSASVTLYTLKRTNKIVFPWPSNNLN